MFATSWMGMCREAPARGVGGLEKSVDFGGRTSRCTTTTLLRGLRHPQEHEELEMRSRSMDVAAGMEMEWTVTCLLMKAVATEQIQVGRKGVVATSMPVSSAVRIKRDWRLEIEKVRGREGVRYTALHLRVSHLCGQQ